MSKVNFLEFKNSRKEIESISEAAEAQLKSDHGILIGDPAVAATVAYVFIENVFKYLNAKKSVGEDIEINFGEILSMGVVSREADEDEEKDGNFVPFAHPGQIAKAIIKSDDDTEE